MRAWPRLAAYVVYTATITFSTRPIVPECCRPTAAVFVPFFACPVSSKIRPPPVGAEVPGQERAHDVSHGVLLPAGAFEQVVQAIRPVQADCLCDRPGVTRNARHSVGEYRFHLLGICTAPQCRSRTVVTVRGACHLRYRCATAVKAALGSHSMSG